MITKKHISSQGLALAMTLMLVSLILILAFAVFQISTGELKATRTVALGGSAYYVAEAGIEDALFKLAKENQDPASLDGLGDIGQGAFARDATTPISNIETFLKRDDALSLSFFDPLDSKKDFAKQIRISDPNIGVKKRYIEVTVLSWQETDPSKTKVEKFVFALSSAGTDISLSNTSRNYIVRIKPLIESADITVDASPGIIPNFVKITSTGSFPKGVLEKVQQAIELDYDKISSLLNIFDWAAVSLKETLGYSAGSWLKVLDGDIHSNKDLTQGSGSVPQGQSSATYMVTASGFISGIGSSQFENSPLKRSEREKYPSQFFQAKDVDLKSIKDGRFAEVAPLPSWNAGSPLELKGRVYLVEGDLVIDGGNSLFETLKIKSSDASLGEFSSGTIYITGSLTIKDNIVYDDSLVGRNSAFESPYAVPSIGWVVEGNVIIDPNVTQIAGAFFAPLWPNGIFSSGSGSNKLDIQGSVVANSFNLQRVPSAGSPGVEILYDGRAILNPPPGFAR